MYYFTTYFDKNYLSRGLVLYDSLKKHFINFKIFVLGLDEFTLEYFNNNRNDYPEIITLSLKDVETSDKELLACKTNRTRIEYYFTLSPCLPLFLIKKYSLPHICSLDADILFLNSPRCLFEYLDEYSIIITSHKFSKELLKLGKTKYGLYNVSFQIFRNDEVGIKCLEKWRKECIDWCGDYYDQKNERYADQKYLDVWPHLYKGKIKVLEDNISGIAPWNLNNYQITKRKKNFYSNGEQIIFYHFHDFKIYGPYWAANGFNNYVVKKQKAVDNLYLSYWRKLQNYNARFSIDTDKSIRYFQQDNKWNRIIEEDFVYFNLKNTSLIYLKYSALPNLLKRILKKFKT